MLFFHDTTTATTTNDDDDFQDDDLDDDDEDDDNNSNNNVYLWPQHKHQYKLLALEAYVNHIGDHQAETAIKLVRFYTPHV